MIGIAVMLLGIAGLLWMIYGELCLIRKIMDRQTGWSEPTWWSGPT